MKTPNTFKLLLLLLCMIPLASCQDDDEKYFTSVPGGGHASRANTVQFYYVDKEGNNLLDPEDLTTYPIPCDTKDSIPDTPTLRENEYYGQYSAQLRKDRNGEVYFSMYAPVDQSTNKYTLYVYFNNTFDQFDLTYGYLPDGTGGDGWTATILSWKINGKHVYADDDKDNKNEIKIYIQKDNENTNVWAE